MKTVSDILNKINGSSYINDSKKEALTAIVLFLERNSSRLGYISYGTLKRQLKDVSQEDIIDSAMLLSSSFHILDIQYEFYDFNEETHDVSRKELREALRDGVYYHPESGCPVIEFEKRIVMYFVQSESFKSMLQK